MTDAVQALGAEKFVSLTTYKKDGAAVATPMWIGRDGDHLFVWTPVDSWKVKRVRNNPRVALAPCSRGGKVREGATAVEGVAEVITEPATVERLAGVIRRIPEHTGALAILVDHDMSLVSACCATTAVLDFGKLIASGPTAAVLRDDAVIRAYLGVDQ